MRKKIGLLMAAWMCAGLMFAQENKMELLQTKLELLDARIQLLDIALRNLEERPEVFQYQMNEMDAWFHQQRDSIMDLLHEAGIRAGMAAQIKPLDAKASLSLDPYRLFEGSLMMSYERAISPSLSLEAALMGTYLTKGGGLGRGYFENQDLATYNEYTRTYEPVDGDMITGWGMVLRAKKYLMARLNPQSKAPLGWYAGPQLMYRNLTIRGLSTQFIDEEFKEIEVTQHLDVFGGGVIIGGKFPLMKVFAVDVHLGGMMRLSRYEGDKKFTRYKSWNNIDYSGVLPSAGISIGILQ